LFNVFLFSHQNETRKQEIVKKNAKVRPF